LKKSSVSDAVIAAMQAGNGGSNCESNSAEEPGSAVLRHRRVADVQ
jgi:hypothetical protein